MSLSTALRSCRRSTAAALVVFGLSAAVWTTPCVATTASMQFGAGAEPAAGAAAALAVNWRGGWGGPCWGCGGFRRFGFERPFFFSRPFFADRDDRFFFRRFDRDDRVFFRRFDRDRFFFTFGP